MRLFTVGWVVVGGLPCLQTYTLGGQAYGSLIDYDVVPSYGKNPYRDITATPETAGGYTMYITKDGNKGFVNEIPAGGGGANKKEAEVTTAGTTSSSSSSRGPVLESLAILMLRLYGTRDPTMWGGVDPPKVSFSNDNGATWIELPMCDDETRLRFNRIMKDLGVTMHDIFGNFAQSSYRWQLAQCPLLNYTTAAEPNFFPQAAATQGENEFVRFKNFDSSYLYWCTSHHCLGDDFIVDVKGKLPIAPNDLYEGVRVADVSKYDVRYMSIEVGDLLPPQPTYNSISWVEMQDFYGKDWDHTFHILAAPSKELLSACHVELEAKTTMFLPFSAEKVKSPPIFPTVILRQQLVTERVLGTHKESHSIDHLAEVCRADGKCQDPAYIKRSMGVYYPEIHVYKCDRNTGHVTPFVYTLAAAPPN